MVNPSTFRMVSVLAGLQRLEAQINQALSNAGAASPEAGVTAQQHTDQVEEQAQKHMARASLALNDIDLLA